ncbi:hypothetical protein MLGJGCBP_01709 [Rhodococcus sp. T7]|nr:hypothetical protein MLGJGCBP_01709 [Rhodococcus sp. T7]
MMSVVFLTRMGFGKRDSPKRAVGVDPHRGHVVKWDG